MSLDPIVSLSVAIAEAPGSVAFFLGSGVSRDAGIPTGWEILRATQQRLRQLETASGEDPHPGPLDDEGLDAWLEDTGRAALNYSELLELLAPDAATRREYLASFFEGRAPGPTHRALADLAAAGFVKVFVTTNFDRLLEQALRERGIEPVVIASDADLQQQVPREHADCTIVKAHGDYLQQTIRNTSLDLAELDPAMTRELGEVFDRYGLAVIGYSGADPAIAEIMGKRSSRYGVWWVARGELEEHLEARVRRLAGRVIRRDGAAAFLTDLRMRLRVFEDHPSGVTPAVTHDETLALLRAGDRVGLGEHLRHEQHAWRVALAAAAEFTQDKDPRDEAAVRGVWETLVPSLERRLASLLPVASYDYERFATEVRGLAEAIEATPRPSQYVAWGEISQVATAWVSYMLGAWLVSLRRFEPMNALLAARWTSAGDRPKRLVSLFGEAPSKVGEVMATPSSNGQRWLSPIWMYFRESLGRAAWAIERYPELTQNGQPGQLLAQFDLVVALDYQFSGETAIGHFAIFSRDVEPFARAIANDAALATAVARAVGADPEDFATQAAAALRGVHEFSGGFGSDKGRIIEILNTGR